MVEGRGRCVGLIRGGRSTKLASTLQAGNSVQLTWRARLEEHLGTFTLEMTDSRAAGLIADRVRLYASQLVCEHLRLLPERDPHDRLLGLAIGLLDRPATTRELGAALARFELVLLDELGFGLDLMSCAATGTTIGLSHVSPKTGRAVSRGAAEPYLNRLLRLPGFLIGEDQADVDAVRDAFALTGHFLDMHVWGPRQLDPPAVRDSLIEAVSPS